MSFPSFLDPIPKEILTSSIGSLKSHCNKNFITIEDDYFFQNIVSTLSAHLFSLNEHHHPLKVCISGGQGSGKTSLSELLQIALREYASKSCAAFSIDDIYKTSLEREKLSRDIHPLCKIRGVPGTHDVELGINTISNLSGAKENTMTPIPAFSKPNDKRVPEAEWFQYNGKPDIILFDAWCGGVPSQPEDSWQGPINELEASEDPNGVWWKWSNDALGGSYQDLFSLFDILIMIEVPDMQTVFESRWLQEQTLAKHLAGTGDENKIMTRSQVDRFVMHYERLTLHILAELPKLADIVLKRDREFKFTYSKTP